ncbi:MULTISPECIES: DUF3291 domain-containing protein [Aliiglaciecola]|uniref:DUF3291 domain-containing protein n=1 Tax=Aliiglaciecola TaxID=1406885 RepID=UPI001C094DF4|nr:MULTISPECIES: DUF3291 domain-containing protein [Aliiglaciecola]MBU2879972.1 DUF3291 domain-containing protein [Aliiglaciecola lipolytica]MDO6711028.1 DUF3291 domain-containing protein [Aliiglaciecola sp. 2_MG-2023]MDO6754238.1 DUF3291 domain-containing protein [Aliiglaciecola sp. 1_MG-2023]
MPYHLAQLNIGKARDSMDSTVMKEFADGLEPINLLAEQSAGFVWRLKDDSGNATNIHYFDDPNMLVNLSVWEDVESLQDFMFKTHHMDFLKQRKKWFQPERSDTYVLWWIPAGHLPEIPEALARLTQLREQGISSSAFTFSKIFPKPTE